LGLDKEIRIIGSKDGIGAKDRKSICSTWDPRDTGSVPVDRTLKKLLKQKKVEMSLVLNVIINEK